MTGISMYVYLLARLFSSTRSLRKPHLPVQAMTVAGLLAAVVISCSADTWAQMSSGQRTGTMICPWSAGGGTDRVSRFWADALQKEMGKPWVVINRTGGAGAIGHFAGAHAPPDGSTITVITFELCTMHRMKISRLTYEDYQCLLQVNADPAALFVRADAPWKSVADLIAAARAEPGKLRMSGTATGGAWDLARIGLQRAADLPVSAITWVPHQGSAPSLVELQGGHLDAVCCSVPEAMAQVESGQLRLLAVMSEERMAEFPNVPTVREQGIDWAAVAWRGLALPKDTPRPVLESLKDTCLKIAASEEFQSFMQKNGFAVRIREPDEFREFLKLQDQQWHEVVQYAGYEKGLTGNNDPGPLALPLVLMIGLVAGGAIEALRSRSPAAVSPQPVSGDSETAVDRDVRRKFGWVLIAMVAYVAAMPWTGFALSTFIFTVILIRRFGGGWTGSLLSAGVLIAVVWLLFAVAFRIQLPGGILGLPF